MYQGSQTQNSDLSLERITASNLRRAIALHREIFPKFSAETNFEEAVSGVSGYEYFIIRKGFDDAGIIGIYSYPEDSASAWLGWFGILQKYRRHHLGSVAIAMFEDMAKVRGYRYIRLYTEKRDNDAAITFYQKNGYSSEEYQNASDPASSLYPLLIFSKSISDMSAPPWGNRNIHFTEQLAKQSLRG